MKIVHCTLLLGMSYASLASAAITASFVPLTSEASSSPPAGYVSQSLDVDTSMDWLAANLIVNLTQGSFYQDAIISGFGPPSSALVSVLPSTRWDTYVTGSLGLDGGAPASAGGAVDLGGNPIATFDTNHIDLNWFTTSTTDIGAFSLGRFTLTNDAEGTFILRLDTLGQTAPLLLTGIVHDGYLTAVPEVNTIVFTGMAVLALGLVVRARRRGQIQG